MQILSIFSSVSSIEITNLTKDYFILHSGLFFNFVGDFTTRVLRNLVMAIFF